MHKMVLLIGHIHVPTYEFHMSKLAVYMFYNTNKIIHKDLFIHVVLDQELLHDCTQFSIAFHNEDQVNLNDFP